MPKKFREMVKIVEADGWRLDRVKGSHHHFKHPTKKGVVTIPKVKNNGDINRRTEESIMKQAGLK